MKVRLIGQAKDQLDFEIFYFKTIPPTSERRWDRGRPDESQVFNICQTSSSQLQSVVGCGRTESHLPFIFPSSWHRLPPKPPIQGCVSLVSLGGIAPPLTPTLPARRATVGSGTHFIRIQHWLDHEQPLILDKAVKTPTCGKNSVKFGRIIQPSNSTLIRCEVAFCCLLNQSNSILVPSLESTNVT